MIFSVRIQIIFWSACLSAYTFGTQVKLCPGKPGRSRVPTGEVTISACQGPPCPLKKNTSPVFSIQFTPNKTIPSLVTKVAGIIAGINTPFIGVDGNDACPDIYSSDGAVKTGCPLNAGTQYLYKTQIEVLRNYPSTAVMVQWALHDPQNKTDVTCFQLASKIVN